MIDRPALLAQIDALGAQLAALRASVAGAGDDAELLDARQSLARFGIGRDGLLGAERRGEISLTRGKRNQVLVSRRAVEEYLRRPHAPTKARTPKAKPSNVTTLADWQNEAEAELKAMGGRR